MRGRSGYRRFRHDDRTIYVVYVLWIIGYSQRAIAVALRLRSKQVAGIIHNSGVYRDRAAMTDSERAQRLSDLRAIRFDENGTPLDGGALDKIPFALRPLTGRQAQGPLRRKVRR